MKRLLFLLAAVTACNVLADDSVIDSPVKRASYAMGADISKNLTQQGVEIDADSFAAGVKAGMGGESLLSTDEIRTEIMRIQTIARESAMKKQQEAQSRGPANSEAGKAFLAENKGKEGVTETASGLQYKVITEGEGDHPAATDTVKVHYTGKLLDGTVFDSSVERGEPAEFGLNQVIAGWTEGVQLMKKGAKYTFWIPSDLAYGERGAGGLIEPGATLEFEVELLDIVK